MACSSMPAGPSLLQAVAVTASVAAARYARCFFMDEASPALIARSGGSARRAPAPFPVRMGALAEAGWREGMQRECPPAPEGDEPRDARQRLVGPLLAPWRSGWTYSGKKTL